jgi:hypothetical protein
VTKISKSLASVYSKPLPSTRSGALYNAFSYVTKISPEAIAVFIATHTKPGDKILDVFGGSGTTGLAALLCDKPSEVMIQMALDLGVEPQWGPRHAVVHELSTLGAFVATVLACPIDPQKFEVAAKQLLAKKPWTPMARRVLFDILYGRMFLFAPAVRQKYPIGTQLFAGSPFAW